MNALNKWFECELQSEDRLEGHNSYALIHKTCITLYFSDNPIKYEDMDFRTYFLVSTDWVLLI